MGRGAFISGAAHAALIALVLTGLPWLSPGESVPHPAIQVSLVSPGELAAAALARGAVAPPQPAPAPAEPPPEAARTPPPAEPSEAPAAETAVPEAPVAGAASPAPAAVPEPAAELGSAGTPPPRPADWAAPATAAPPSAPAAGAAGSAARTAPATTAGARTNAAPPPELGAAVREALARAQFYPARVRARGITGAASIEITLDRDGGLVAARLAQSSGSAELDAASLAAARRARFPSVPDAPAGARFSFTVRLVYDLR